MSKELLLKDYAPYYLGCEVMITGTGNTGRLTTISILGNMQQRFSVLIGATSIERSFNFETDKLVLRPLSTMTDEELQKCGNMNYDFSDDPELNNHKWEYFTLLLSVEQFHYLLLRHFDLFGLVDAGLATDKTKLP